MRRQMIYVYGSNIAGIRYKVIWNSSQFCKDPYTFMSCLSLCSFSILFICEFLKVYRVLFFYQLASLSFSILQDLNEPSHVYISLNVAGIEEGTQALESNKFKIQANLATSQLKNFSFFNKIFELFWASSFFFFLKQNEAVSLLGKCLYYRGNRTLEKDV